MERAKFFFPLRDAYYYGRRLNYELRDKLGGQLVQDSRTTALLAQTVRYAGDGDYIEIGSLHGGSAITAALVKKEFNLEGIVYCIEPNPRNILENAKLFKVEDRIKIVKKTSNELKELITTTDNMYFSLESKSFSCGFIDGDHRDSHPLDDWYKLRNIISRYIIFDDYDKSEKGVVSAVQNVMHCCEEWIPVHLSGALVIFENYAYRTIQK